LTEFTGVAKNIFYPLCQPITRATHVMSFVFDEDKSCSHV